MMRCCCSTSRPVVSVSSTTWRIGIYRPASRRSMASIRQLIDVLVAVMARMPLDPMPFDVLRRGGRIQPLPQILILDRLARGGAPAARLPVRQPFGDALQHVLRIGVQLHRAAALQRAERLDRGRELHAVVGGRRLRRPTASLRSLPATSSAAQPPGPGLPRQAPSVIDLDRRVIGPHFAGRLRGAAPARAGARGAAAAPGSSVGTRLRALSR